MQYILYVLLLANVGWVSAHANCVEHPQQTVLDNQDKIIAALKPSTVVRNWSLVCTYHCSATQAGVPCSCICNVAAKNIPKTHQNRAYQNNKAIIHSDVLINCGNICSSHFDEEKISALPQLPSAEIIEIINKQFGNVCRNLFDYKPTAMDDCSICLSKFIGNQPIIAADSNKNYKKAESSPTDETTPDWNDLCISLCKTGDGGALCNCNLSPFNF